MNLLKGSLPMTPTDPDLTSYGEQPEIIARIDWTTSHAEQPGMLALIEGSDPPGHLLRNVRALALALGTPVTAAALIEEEGGGDTGPVDPLDWVARRDERRDVACAALGEAGMSECRVIVFTGKDQRQLLDWVEPRRDLLVALSPDRAPRQAGAQPRDLLDALVRQGTASLFVVRAVDPVEPPWRRILIPLSGAIGAEAVLPTVERIAARMNASVTLAYLRSKQHSLFPEDRSEAENYLSGIVSRMGEWIERVETRYLPLEDAGRALIDLVAREGIDLVVTLDQGSSEGRVRALPEPTRHLIDHCPVPLLLLRHGFHLTALPWMERE